MVRKPRAAKVVQIRTEPHRGSVLATMQLAGLMHAYPKQLLVRAELTVANKWTPSYYRIGDLSRLISLHERQSKQCENELIVKCVCIS